MWWAGYLVLPCLQLLAFLASVSSQCSQQVPCPHLSLLSFALSLYFYDPSGLSAAEQVCLLDMESHYMAYIGPEIWALVVLLLQVFLA